MALLIKNGEIVTASERYVADILCENETITRIDRGITPPKGAEVVDAKGKFVFPGFIDPHVHIYLPFMGTFSKDDYITGSEAALVGGTGQLPSIVFCAVVEAEGGNNHFGGGHMMKSGNRIKAPRKKDNDFHGKNGLWASS